MNRFLALLVSSRRCSAAAAQAPQPPEVAAKSYLLLDMTSHQVLAERDADAPADPASLTKLMTAYIVFSALRDKKLSVEQTLPVSLRAWAERKGGGSLMFIEPRSTPEGQRPDARHDRQLRATTPRWRSPKAWAAPSRPSSR